SQKDIAPGSEEFVDAQECLRRAVVTGRSDLCQYFVERTDIDVDRALITAAGNKEIFDELVIRYRVDLYSPQNIDLLYSILIEAINQKNFPLIYSLSPRASQVITDPENIEEMMTE